MASYKISKDGDVLKVGFADPAQNDVIVRDAVQALADLALTGGARILVNGPASLPVACVLAHALGHLYGIVGVFDPKLAAYVVAISHNPAFPIGTLIPM
jgi:CRISPR-associated protein Csx3